MPKIINKRLDGIIDFSLSKTNGSKFTKSFVQEHKGNVPVYGASSDEKEVSYGYIQDNLSGIKYFDNCLTWNIDGSRGVFLREGHFSLSEKVIPLIPFEDIISSIDLNYLKYVIMFSKEYTWFGFSNKAGKNKLKEIQVAFPVLEDGTFDLEKQKELAQKYADIEEKKAVLLDKVKLLKEHKIIIDRDTNCKYIDINFNDMFILSRGNVISKADINEHIGKYNVYSTQCGIYGKIDSYMREGEFLLWNTDGLAGYIKKVNGKFSFTNIVGIMIPTNKYDMKSISLDYLKYYLEPIFRENRKGRMGINGKNEYTKLNSTMIKKLDIKIPIPIKDDGAFDLEKQKEIAQKYAAIQTYKQNIYNQIKELTNISIN